MRAAQLAASSQVAGLHAGRMITNARACVYVRACVCVCVRGPRFVLTCVHRQRCSGGSSRSDARQGRQLNHHQVAWRLRAGSQEPYNTPEWDGRLRTHVCSVDRIATSLLTGRRVRLLCFRSRQTCVFAGAQRSHLAGSAIQGQFLAMMLHASARSQVGAMPTSKTNAHTAGRPHSRKCSRPGQSGKKCGLAGRNWWTGT
jgi:hypothetical protein